MKILLYILPFLILSCDSSDDLKINNLLQECTSINDSIQYSGSSYNCGDLFFLNDFSNYNESFSASNLIEIGIQTWSPSGRLLDLILYNETSYQVDYIPESISNLNALLVLDLSGDIQNYGDLNYINNEIGDLTNLKELYLNYNQLMSIPESIGDLSNLEVLWINNNMLASIPNNLCNLNLTCEVKIENNLLCNEFNYTCFENFSDFSWDWQNQEDCCNELNGECP